MIYLGEILYGKESSDAYDVVEEALDRKKGCRNSDEFLVWYCKKYLIPDEEADLNSYEGFKSSPGMRTLIRKRAEIQNEEDRFPPTKPDVAKERNIKEEVIWQHYSSDSEILQRFKEEDFFKEESSND